MVYYDGKDAGLLKVEVLNAQRVRETERAVYNRSRFCQRAVSLATARSILLHPPHTHILSPHF
jgi:hypothetical protein